MNSTPSAHHGIRSVTEIGVSHLRGAVHNPAAVNWLEGVITFQGRQDNLALRQAAIIALVFNIFMVLVAIMSIMLTVPHGKKTT